LPDDVEFDRCGTLWVASDDEEMDEVGRKYGIYAAAGIPTEVLSAQDVAQLEPHLRPMAGALLVPSDCVLYPPCAAGYLVREALRQGATLFAGKRVISAGAGRVQLEDGSELRAPRIVVAGGADAVLLIPDLPIRKRKGHLVITDRYPGFVRHQLVELGYLKSAHSIMTDSVAFNVQPRRTGQLLIGSSREYGAEDHVVNHALLAAMIARVQAFIPQIGDLQAIRVWTGFRAATPDKLPLIGPWPGDETVFLATGHEGLGITTSLATAKVLASTMLGAVAAIDPAPYLPSRYTRADAVARPRASEPRVEMPAAEKSHA
jgi:glycine/D-amino acid oxidase-like deaminating enzyme